MGSKKGAVLSKPAVRRVMENLTRHWSNAHCELAYHTEFQLLLAVVLSAQTTDIAVNRALTPILAGNPAFGPAELLVMGEAGFLERIRSIGLAPTKAKNAIGLAEQLLSRFQGQVPRTQEELESLPGVGRKTANVVRNVLFGEPTMPVDTHVERVSVRLGLVEPTTNRVLIEETLLQRIPADLLPRAHHVLIFHGRYLCMARNPRCPACPVRGDCLDYAARGGDRRALEPRGMV